MHPAEQRLLGCATPPPPSHPPAASPRRKWQSIVIIAAGLRATDTTHYAARWHSLMEILDHWPCQQVKCYVCDLSQERGQHEGIRLCVGRAAIWQKNIYWKKTKKGFHSSFPRIGMLGRYTERRCQACYPHAQMRFICWEKCKHVQLVGRRTQKIWMAEITHNRP